MQGIFPKALKVTKIVPVYKKGDKSCPSSYRPISLIPIFGKVFEYCVKEQLYCYFLHNNFLCKEQYGFLPGRCTIKAVESVIETILMNFEKKLVTSATLIDLSKAFDCISHQLLLEKMFYYGVQDKELALLSSYLSDRQQMVVQGKDKSSFKTIRAGVPQGSVLGPFLFIVAVNDLASNIPCKTVLYADDTTLLNSCKQFDELISIKNSSVDSAAKWFEANFLKINNDKTENICFSLDYNIYTNFNPVKLLGIHLDSRLSWECHVQNM